MRYSLLTALLIVSFLFAGAPAMAQDEDITLADAESLLIEWEANAAAVESAIEANAESLLEDEKRRAQIEEDRTQAQTIADQAKAEMVPVQEQLDVLGPAPAEGETEAPEVAEDRAELQAKLDGLKATSSKADLAFTRADSLLERITVLRRQKFTDQLLTRGPTPLDPNNWILAGESLLATGADVAQESSEPTKSAISEKIWTAAGAVSVGALMFALMLVFVARRAVLKWLYRILGDRGPPTANVVEEGIGTDLSEANPETLSQPPLAARSRTIRLLVGIGVTVTRLATPLIALIAARYALVELQVFGSVGKVVLDGLAWGAAILATAYAIVYAFFAPTEPRLRLSLLDSEHCASAARYSMLIALAMALNTAVINVGESLGWPVGALNVINAAIILGGCLALWRLARVTATIESAATPVTLTDDTHDDSEQWLSRGAGRIVRRVAYAVAIISPLLALAGYFALSRFVFYNTLLTAAVMAAGILLFSVAKEGTSALSDAARERKGDVAVDDDREGGLLPVFVGFILILVALPILALVWGATRDDLGEVYFGLSNGFTIGDSTFRPGDILIAALVFGAGLFITRIVQAVIRRTVMPRTRLDTGVRSSIVSGLGYLGFFLAALIAISAGGLDLTNLAFLGAALGVGIGFGLQNIVNNFVSGIILLIERPIKVGDWIEVAGTHGTVQKINVRSTEIKTFDKASYIVPNSELISGAVMNMTHGDLMGRVIAPVGVAYGSDTRQVEKILMEILRAHPMVLRRPPPSVVFQGFGADSLDFEARGFLRDVNWILSTRSDMNFEIERRFREEGIEIPFRQNDVNLKNVHDLIDAMQGKPEN